MMNILDLFSGIGGFTIGFTPPIVYQFAMAIRAFEETEDFVNGAF